MKVIHGNSKEVLRSYNDNTFDCIVTDPPYELGFMGKGWDKSGIAYDVDLWKQCLRVLKPGGHLLSFGGSRTYHRMACAIEDAGFEIRDQIMWVYAQGFPKSLDIAYEMHKRAEQAAKHDLRFMLCPYLQKEVYACKECGQILLEKMQEQSSQNDWRKGAESEITRSEQPCLEGWSYFETPERELYRCKICTMSHGVFADGEKRRVYNGTQISYGDVNGTITDKNRSCTSHRPQTVEQPVGEPDAVRYERRAQEIRGFGTALKPAHEPICVARKPLSEKTVADNVLKWSVGGLNIDGCRVETERGGRPKRETHKLRDDVEYSGNALCGRLNGSLQSSAAVGVTDLGRFPANIIHDGSDEVLAGFPDAPGQMGRAKDDLSDQSNKIYGKLKHGTRLPNPRVDSSKSAARFFYCAKASKADRGEGNTHPTVKPTELMRYLVRLVCPPGGLILDPFAGSGSTLKACQLEGFDCVGIELDYNHISIINSRLSIIEKETATVVEPNNTQKFEQKRLF